MTTMTTQTTWDVRYRALEAFAKEFGHTRVPIKYEVGLSSANGYERVNLGTWVSYLRTRYRKELLSQEQVDQLEALPGWEWGPLQPGPKSDQDRDEQILTMYNSKASLADIGRAMGLSRQRIHQIIKGRLTV